MSLVGKKFGAAPVTAGGLPVESPLVVAKTITPLARALAPGNAAFQPVMPRTKAIAAQLSSLLLASDVADLINRFEYVESRGITSPRAKQQFESMEGQAHIGWKVISLMQRASLTDTMLSRLGKTLGPNMRAELASELGTHIAKQTEAGRFAAMGKWSSAEFQNAAARVLEAHLAKVSEAGDTPASVMYALANRAALELVPKPRGLRFGAVEIPPDRRFQLNHGAPIYRLLPSEVERLGKGESLTGVKGQTTTAGELRSNTSLMADTGRGGVLPWGPTPSDVKPLW